MTATIARNGIIAISLLSIAAFLPGILRWYRHHHDRILRYDHRFRVQHLSHLVLLIHHLIVILLLLSLHPLSFVPAADGVRWLGGAYAPVVIAGLGLYALGNALRIWAAYVMGSSFDKAVLIRADHHLSTNGPYRLARHPIYVGNLLAEIGLGLALACWPLVAYTVVLSFPVWNYRASVEEVLLIEHFGEQYREYSRKVGRWLPR